MYLLLHFFRVSRTTPSPRPPLWRLNAANGYPGRRCPQTGYRISIPFPATSTSSRPQACSAQVRHRDAGLPRREPTGP